MHWPIFRYFLIFACTMLVAPIFGPAQAEELSNNLQHERDYYNALSQDACAGDSEAYRKLKADALDHDNPVAKNSLAWLYLGEECFSYEHGVTYAIELQIKSASAGYPIAINNYANRLLMGLGVTQNPDLAIEYFERAIGKGYGTSAAQLGMYYLGGEYLRQDYGRAVELLRVAVREGADSEDISELSELLDEVSAQVVGLYPQQQAIEWEYEVGLAGWGLVLNGRVVAEVFVDLDVDTGQLYYGFTRVSTDPILHFMGVSVMRSGNNQELHFGKCGANNCLERFESAGEAGSDTLRIPIVPNARAATLEAMKAGKDITFRFQTRDSYAEDQYVKLSFDLRGSRAAIEYVERDATLAGNSNTQGSSTGTTYTTDETVRQTDPAAINAGGKFSGTPITCYHASSGISPDGIRRELQRQHERLNQVNAAVIADPIGNLILQYIWGGVVYERVAGNRASELYTIVERRDHYTGTTECLPGDFEHVSPEAAVEGLLARQNERGNSVFTRAVLNWKQRILRLE